MNAHSEPIPPAFLLRSRRIVLPNSEVDGAVEIRGSRIARIHDASQIPGNLPTEDLGDLALLPGLVDAHVHINEPGRTDWEGFESATRAALAGGITTLLDMPLNSSPVSTTAESLRKKREAARGKLWVDVGFYGGLVRGNAHRMQELIEEGVFGIKAFLCDSGLDEFQAATEEDLREAMPILARMGTPLLVHAELPGDFSRSPANRRSHAEWLASRPPEFELRAIEMVLRLARETGCQVHIVHLSAADALPMLAAAQWEGVPVVVETCPHYLIFSAENVPDGDTRFKCAPPIRNAENRERLWQGLRDGIISRIASDHSPCPPAMKALDSGDFFDAWGGISSLQLGLAAVWTEAQSRGFSLRHVCHWMNTTPSLTLGSEWPYKGFLFSGSEADLVAFDPDKIIRVRGTELHHRHPITPYEGRWMRGSVEHVWKGGRRVYRDREFVAPRSGRALFRFGPESNTSCSTVPALSGLSSAVQDQVYESACSPLSAATLEALNNLPADAAREVFFRCCGKSEWATLMAAYRPFRNSLELYASAADQFKKLFRNGSDWLEPFSHHPRIGDIDSLRAKFATTRTWASQEQSGTAAASEETLQALAAGNEEYERKFGYIFIVCATGKSADEMLGLLRERLKNDPKDEWRIAAEEQKKITCLRLGKLEIPS